MLHVFIHTSNTTEYRVSAGLCAGCLVYKYDIYFKRRKKSADGGVLLLAQLWSSSTSIYITHTQIAIHHTEESACGIGMYLV